MLIDCPSCARSYHVSRVALGESGRHVVCQFCDTRWFVEVPPTEPTLDTGDSEGSAPDETICQVDTDSVEIMQDTFLQDETALQDEVEETASKTETGPARPWKASV